LQSVVKIGKVISVDDSGDIRTAVVSAMGKQQRVNMMMPYGDMASPPPGSLAIMYAVQGHDSSIVAIADDPNNRTIKGLQPGERAVGNYLTGANIYFAEDGSVVITSGESTVSIDAEGNIIASATGNISATAQGDIVASAANNVSITSDANNVQITGNTTITGDTNIIGNLIVSGTVGCAGVSAGSGTVSCGDVQSDSVTTSTIDTADITTNSAIIGGIDFVAHVHSGVVSGANNTGPVVP
jgi:phage gp45-like